MVAIKFALLLLHSPLLWTLLSSLGDHLAQPLVDSLHFLQDCSALVKQPFLLFPRLLCAHFPGKITFPARDFFDISPDEGVPRGLDFTIFSRNSLWNLSPSISPFRPPELVVSYFSFSNDQFHYLLLLHYYYGPYYFFRKAPSKR